MSEKALTQYKYNNCQLSEGNYVEFIRWFQLEL